jgi:PAS domain S-box-containing protein/diguanylate cyclase (GGDEF)-like protein
MTAKDVPRNDEDMRAAFAELQVAENDQIGSIIEVQRAVASADLDVDAVMRLICERTQQLTHAEGATILILDGDAFVLRVATGFLQDRVGDRVPIEGSQPGWMHLHDESGILLDAKVDPRAGRIARETGMRSGVAVQLRHRNEKIGQLVVVSRQLNAFTNDHVETLKRLSAVLSSALFHAAEFETRGQQVEALARFETIYRSATVGIVLVGPDGRFIDANPAYERMSGYTVEELVEMSPFDLIHPDDVDRMEGLMLDLIAGRRDSSDVEARAHRKDGGLIWTHATTTMQSDSQGVPQFSITMLEDITERKEAEEKLTYLAYNDEHTGLANRSGFMQELEASIARADALGLAVGVIDMNIDNFRLVNDSLGYVAGDELLTQIASRLRDLTGGTVLAARRGGDKFLLLVGDLADGLDASSDGEGPLVAVEAVARQVHELVTEPFILDGVDVIITASLGIAMFPHDATDAKTLVGHGEVAMYRSKAVGPGRTLAYARTGEDPMRRLQLATRLRKAVERQSWELHYQPVVDLNDGRIGGVEALIRGRAENGDLIPPGDFIPLAEEIGLIGVIGDWVIDEMCRQMQAWKRAGLEPEVGFNVSPSQLLSARFAADLIQRLETAGVDLHRVVVEVTESAALSDPKHTREILASLHDAGLMIAIDDFGTGYSSLGRLKDLPIDILKIDRSFVADAHLGHDAGTLVRAMVQLAKNLGMTPLAEGIETMEELAFLRTLDCPMGQGYLFSRPLPASKMTELLLRGSSLIVIPAA